MGIMLQPLESKRAKKPAGFLSPISSKITPTKEKGEEKKNERGWRKEKRKKAMAALVISFYSYFKFGF